MANKSLKLWINLREKLKLKEGLNRKLTYQKQLLVQEVANEATQLVKLRRSSKH